MIDALRSWMDIHPVILIFIGLVLYGAIVSFRPGRAAPLDDDLSGRTAIPSSGKGDDAWPENDRRPSWR